MTGSALLRSNRNFLRYFLGDVVSTLGSQLSLLAFPLLVLSLGESVAEAGLLTSCSLVARLALRLPAGNLADRFDWRRLMLTTDLVRLVALGSIPIGSVAGTLSYQQLLVVAVVEGIGTAIFSPAAGVAVRDVVPKADLTEALSLSQTVVATALLVGPAIGGVLFSVNPIVPFICDAASYAFSAVMLFQLTVRPPKRAPGAETDTRFSAGIRWVLGQRSLLWILLHAAVLNLTGAAAEIGVVLTLRSRGESGSVIGLVMACAGLGAVLGSALAPAIVRRCYPGLLFLSLGAAWGAGFALFALAPRPALIGAVLIVMMLTIPATNVVINGAIIGNAPRDLLGRVNTAISTVLAALAVLGPTLVSLGIQDVGIRATWCVMAVVAGGVAMVTVRPLLRLRQIVQPADAPEASAPFEAVPATVNRSAPELA
ncbi:MAG TPA: MFS transporter [Jatrophihabitans sp.]|jgi:predicted MFS family arabinose efflux permease|nr:MFS transporter [Jatrophihabitans sp.]